MTNLSFNNSRYTATGNRQQISSGLDKVDKIEILSKIRPIFFQHFEQAVDDCCMRIDLEFGLQLGKHRERLSKEQYIKLLEYVRSVRREIKQNYLAKVHRLFDDQKTIDSRSGELNFFNVSLTGDEAVKENHAINLIIRQCERACYEELIGLNKQFAFRRGKQTIADSQNPIFPEQLIRALAEAVRSLKLNTDGRIAIYKAFEVNVFKHLGFIYSELMRRCDGATTAPLADVAQAKEQHGSVPSLLPLHRAVAEREDLAGTSSEQPSAEFRLMQKKLELWRLAHFPSVYDVMSAAGNIFYEPLEIKNALQVLQLANDGSNREEKKQPLKRRLLKKLEELSFSIDSRVLARHDEDMLDLAALIFNEIEQDKLLPDAVKTALLQLEIPLAAASVGKYSVFTSRDSAVRQLLDDLFAAGMFLNNDESDDQLIRERIAGAVKRITKDSGFELSGWATEAGEFSNYMNKQKQRSQRIEENARQFMIDKQVVASNRKIVATVIENSIKGKKLPAAIAEFLRDVWSRVLLDAYTGKDEQPERWEKSVQAMDELIVSVMPPADDQQRKQILKLLPGLIAELRNGLKQISYEKSAQSRFFKELAVWHIILMDKKEAKKTVGDIVSAAPVESEKIIDENSAQAGNLAEGSWVAFSSESGRLWGKLLWKDAAAEAMLFVGKNGAKIFELQDAELAEKLRKGQAAIVKFDTKTITERVFLKLMSL